MPSGVGPVELIRGVAVRGGRGRDVLGDGGLGGRRAGAFAVQRHVGEAADLPVVGWLQSIGRHAPNRVSRVESASTASILAVR